MKNFPVPQIYWTLNRYAVILPVGEYNEFLEDLDDKHMSIKEIAIHTIQELPDTASWGEVEEKIGIWKTETLRSMEAVEKLSSAVFGGQ